MSPVAIDADLVAKLISNGSEVPLTDPDGKPVGYFVSPREFEYMRKAMYDLAFAEVSEEEFQQAEAQPGRYSTAEVLKLLGLE